jgi:hypothetical protein
MTTGELCAFTRNGFEIQNVENKRYSAGHLPLALAVAASSAFPPLFPPVALSHHTLNADAKDFPLHHYLTDGGIFDNVGIVRMRHAASASDRTFDKVIISNASAAFETRSAFGFSLLHSRTIRSTDILMQRVAAIERTLTNQNDHILWADIGDIVSNEDIARYADTLRPQDKYVQALCKSIRTDLNVFTEDEMRGLIRHGYEVGVKCFGSTQCSKSAPELHRAIESSISRIIDPCIAGWHQVPELMDMNRKLHPLNVAKKPLLDELEKLILLARTGEKLRGELMHVVSTGSQPLSLEDIRESVARDRAAQRNTSNAPEVRKELQHITHLRQILLRSHTTPWCIWYWRDWASWVIFFLMGAGCYAFVRWLFLT